MDFNKPVPQSILRVVDFDRHLDLLNIDESLKHWRIVSLRHLYGVSK